MFASYILLAFTGKWLVSLPVMLVAFAAAEVSFFFGDDEYCICFALFLVPNIRMMDVGGIQVLTNLMLLTPVATRFIRVRKINFTALAHTTLLLGIDLIHIMYNRNFEDLIPNASSILVLYFVESTLLDKNTIIRLSHAARALALGAIFSAVFYFIIYTKYIDMSRYFRGYRYTAFASDPNYYSLYICLSIAMILILKKHLIYDYIIIFSLIAIELFTASKMAILLILLMLIYFSAKMIYSGFSRKTKFFRRLIIIGAVLVAVFSQFVVTMIDKLMTRVFARGTNMTLDKLTTRRSTLQVMYMNKLIVNPILLLFGYGVHYNKFFESNISHNTYLDIVLSWGLIGLAVFISIFFTTIRGLVAISSERLNTDHFLPLIVLVISFFSLSCVSASMFWWIICAALLSLRGIEEPQLTERVLRGRAPMVRLRFRFHRASH